MPTDRKPLLFVSSTSDLTEERAAVSDVMPRSIEVYRYEEDTARRQSPRDRLRDVLASTDVFVGIFGHRYGSPYPGCEADRSIVEYEFDTALGQAQTEVMAFRRQGGGQQAEPEQQRFLDRVGDFRDGVWVKDFDGVDAFRNEVGRSVMNWLTAYWEKSLADATPAALAAGRRQAVVHVAVGIGVGIVLAGVAVAVVTGTIDRMTGVGCLLAAAAVAVGGSLLSSQ